MMSSTADMIGGLRPLELHYFRIPRERWELMLVRVRQMGANAISTVVPWGWHEPRNGLFDLTGIVYPTRDVTDFLGICQAMSLRVVLRVSPYVGAGLLGGGVAGWLLREFPEICTLDPDSQPRRDPASGSTLPSAEHPTYLKYVERWYRELTDVMASWQAPGGPIVALRVNRPSPDDSDRQTEGIPSHWDYNPHVIQVQWTVWLRQQYDGIDALNAAWQTDYHSFSDAVFPRQTATPEPSLQLPGGDQQVTDAARFVAYADNRATETYARLLREMGWTVPIVTDQDASSATLELSHAVQVDPEPPQVGTGVRWATDAPLRGDGSPRAQFWAVKATLLGMEQGVKPVEGGTLVTGSESRRVRLPRPRGDYGVYRLLLDGQFLDASSRRRGDALQLNYVAADEAGETDMYIVLDDRSDPLSVILREYLASLLTGRAGAMGRTSTMCQVLAEALSSATPPVSEDKTVASTEDLQAAEQSLVEARRAAHRAAASLGKLERLASEVRGEMPPSAPTLPDLSAFSPQDRERLAKVREACAQVVPMLKEAGQSFTALGQDGEPGGEGLTISMYRAAFAQSRACAREAENVLTSALGRLRADLSAGALSPPAWTLQNWLTRILQGLAAG